MIRKHKGTLLLTSLVTLLPALAGALLWDRLPLRMATHWGIDGIADGWSGKALAVFGLSLILLAVHWLCVLVTAADRKNREQNRKVYALTLWIIPAASVFVCGTVYAAALGREVAAEVWTTLLLGLLFLVIGNYLPKCRQNRTIGIKVKWTLESEENWNATHRMAGKLWVACGLLFLVSAFLPGNGFLWAMAVVVPVAVLVPTVYSYRFHCRQVRAGTAPAAKERTPGEKKVFGISLLVSVLILVGCGILCFTGEIETVYGDTAFTLEASYYQDLTVEYAAVDSVELREGDTPGRRQFGFGSPRLLMGQFKNEAYGEYTRYSYTKSESCVVLGVRGETLVIGGADGAETRAIYEELIRRCE